MRSAVLLLLLVTCGCAAVKVQESQRNPEFTKQLDKIAIKWEPLKEYDFTFQSKKSSNYYAPSPVQYGKTANQIQNLSNALAALSPSQSNTAIASTAVSINEKNEINRASEHIKDIGKRYPVLLARELLHYDTDIVNRSEATYELLTTTGSDVHILCKSTGCSSRINVEFTLKEIQSDATVWSSVMTVWGSQHPYWERAADGKKDVSAKDSTRELAETIVKEWEKHKLLSARSDQPRVAPAGNIASRDVKAGTVVQLNNLPSGDIVTKPTNPDYLDKEDPEADRIVEWCTQNYIENAKVLLLRDVQNEIASLHDTLQATWEIGWLWTKSRRAYRLAWTKNKLEITELKPKEAASLGINEGSRKFRTRKN